jgi:ATP-dependent protease ClpP protease subunit
VKQPVHIFNYNIRNSADQKTVDIFIDGDIVDASTQAMIQAFFGDTTTTSYKSFRNQIDKVDADVYNFYYNSDGGHVGDALAMHDLIIDLQNKGKKVKSIGRGIIASSATLPFLAANETEMSANSFMLIHSVSGGVHGTLKEVRNFADTMEKFQNKIVKVYSAKTGLTEDVLATMMSNETWMDSEEAQSKGFVSKITGAVEFENKIDPELWMHSDKSILNLYNKSVKPISEPNLIEDMKKLFNTFAANITAAIKGVKPADESQKPLVDSIATAVGSAFEPMGDQFETEVNNHVTNFFASEPGKKVITDFLASEAGRKPITDFLASEEGKKLVTGAVDKEMIEEVFEAEITNSRGGKTFSNNGGGKVSKPIGGFVED